MREVGAANSNVLPCKNEQCASVIVIVQFSSGKLTSAWNIDTQAIASPTDEEKSNGFDSGMSVCGLHWLLLRRTRWPSHPTRFMACTLNWFSLKLWRQAEKLGWQLPDHAGRRPRRRNQCRSASTRPVAHGTQDGCVRTSRIAEAAGLTIASQPILRIAWMRPENLPN